MGNIFRQVFFFFPYILILFSAQTWGLGKQTLQVLRKLGEDVFSEPAWVAFTRRAWQEDSRSWSPK